jgi:ATP-binding cassette, subfamily B, bacterial IrtA/YbtP
LEALRIIECLKKSGLEIKDIKQFFIWVSEGSHKYLTYASWVLSAISALIALVPFYYIWKMIKEVLEVAPDFGQAQNLTGNGWMAVLFAVLAVLVYIAGLMCSHLGAFRIATNLRIQTMEHIVKLPLGFAESFGSGKLRKIVNESSAATETYLAHQLPDRANAIATPCGLLVLLFVFDWRLGLLSLVPVVLGFLIMIKRTRLCSYNIRIWVSYG